MWRSSRRRPPRRTAVATRPGRLGELHDDPERLLRVKERFLPFGIGVVVADDVVPSVTRAGARLLERWHTERHVVDARPPRLEKPREKTVGAGGLEDLDPPSSCESPLSETIVRRRSAMSRRAAELSRESSGRVGHASDRDGDMIEEN